MRQSKQITYYINKKIIFIICGLYESSFLFNKKINIIKNQHHFKYLEFNNNIFEFINYCLNRYLSWNEKQKENILLVFNESLKFKKGYFKIEKNN